MPNFFVFSWSEGMHCNKGYTEIVTFFTECSLLASAKAGDYKLPRGMQNRCIQQFESCVAIFQTQRKIIGWLVEKYLHSLKVRLTTDKDSLIDLRIRHLTCVADAGWLGDVNLRCSTSVLCLSDSQLSCKLVQ